MKSMRYLAVMLAFALTACVSVKKVESGDIDVGGRLRVTLDGPWNQITAPHLTGPHCQTWTMEGLPIDELLIYSGLKNGEAIHSEVAAAKDQKSFEFHTGMQPEQIVALFEGQLTRDGSVFKMTRLEPSSFGGVKGFHFEYSLTRKRDNVELLGTASVAIDNGEMFAILYQAPRLVFYPRHVERVTRILQAARVQAKA